MEIEQKPKESIREMLLRKKVIAVLVLLVLIGFGGMVTASNKPEFCAMCHNMQSYYESYHSTKMLAKTHGDAGVTCHDCHQASMAQQIDEGIKYITGDFETPMEKRKFSNEFCTRCHDMNKVKAKTAYEDKGIKANPHDSHLGEQDCNACHSMHQPSSLACGQCHYTQQWMKKLPEYWKKI